MKPFIELGANIRAYDLEVDAGGNNRSSQGGYGNGTTIEAACNLTGEVSFDIDAPLQGPTLADVMAGRWTPRWSGCGPRSPP